MSNFMMGLVTAFVLLPIGAVSCFVLGLTDVQSDVQPTVWESKLMTMAVRASVKRNASSIPRATTAGDEMLIIGGKLYVAGCVGCHGELGKPIREDHDNFPRVPQLPQRGTGYSQPEIYWIVKHGIRMSAMSAYGPFYSEQQLWALSAFVHQIKDLPPNVLQAIQVKE